MPCRWGILLFGEKGHLVMATTDFSGREPEPRLLVRRGIPRLTREQWGSGRSVWEADLGGRDLVVDHVEVSEGAASENAARVLGLEVGERVWSRSRRFVLDGKPVLLPTSYLPAPLVEGSAITQPDTGPGGIYARLAELGYGPIHFREEIRSRMPLPE